MWGFQACWRHSETTTRERARNRVVGAQSRIFAVGNSPVQNGPQGSPIRTASDRENRETTLPGHVR